MSRCPRCQLVLTKVLLSHNRLLVALQVSFGLSRAIISVPSRSFLFVSSIAMEPKYHSAGILLQKDHREESTVVRQARVQQLLVHYV